MIQILELKDHSKDFTFLVQLTKPQIFSFPLEESQMFTSKEPLYSPATPNNINYETENRNSLAADYSQIDAKWNASKYIGLSNYDVPFQSDIIFYNLSITNVETQITVDLEVSKYLTIIRNGLHKITIPANEINLLFEDPENSDLSFLYGQYVFEISPKYFETSVLNILPRKQYPIQNYSGAINSNRRTIYQVNPDTFKGTVWNFESFPKQSGRLMGSFVEVYDLNENIKNTKTIAENDFNDLGTYVNLVLSMDNVGYDSQFNSIEQNDTLRIYPRETFFTRQSIVIDYVNPINLSDSAYKYLLHDVVRNIKTGVMELYDGAGVTVNADGSLNGNVIQTYQMQQIGEYEIRKKIN